MTGPPPLPPAGWYPDSALPPGWLRYFDGLAWTGHVTDGTSSRHGGATAVEGDHPTLPVKFAVVGVFVAVASLLVMHALQDPLSATTWPTPLLVVIVVTVSYGPIVAFLVLASRSWGSGSIANDYGLRLTARDICLWGVAAYFGVAVATVITSAMIEALNVPFESNAKNLDQLRDNKPILIAVAIATILVAPVVEEILFRGAVLRGLLSVMGAWPAIALQGFGFGLVHFDPSRGAGNVGLILTLAVVGCGFGYVTFHLRRLGASMAAHALVNTISLLVAVYFPNLVN